MFENYREMGEEEKAAVKAAHKAVRAQAGSRHGNLAWGFMRGFPYKRIERSVRTHVGPDGGVHKNAPYAASIVQIIAAAVPGFAPYDPSRPWNTKATPEIEAWLASEDGAIPAPVRVKRPPPEREVA
jgi:hypothetical protein